MGWSPTEISGFGVSSEASRSRSPRPPQKMTTFTSPMVSSTRPGRAEFASDICPALRQRRPRRPYWRSPRSGETSLRVLVTGHNGYIGSVLVPLLRGAGHDVSGLDSDLFEPCVFGTADDAVESIRKDVRDVEKDDLVGFD